MCISTWINAKFNYIMEYSQEKGQFLNLHFGKSLRRGLFGLARRRALLMRSLREGQEIFFKNATIRDGRFRGRSLLMRRAGRSLLVVGFQIFKFPAIVYSKWSTRSGFLKNEMPHSWPIRALLVPFSARVGTLQHSLAIPRCLLIKDPPSDSCLW